MATQRKPKPSYKLEPLKLWSIRSLEAWAYEEARGIVVYIQREGEPSVFARISRAQILDYLKRDRAVRRSRKRKASDPN